MAERCGMATPRPYGKDSTVNWYRLQAAIVTAALMPLALGGSGGAPVSAPAPSHPASSAWASNIWMGSASSGPGLTLADVRGIIGAGSGAAASLTGAGVGVALIDTGVAPVA